MKIEVRVQPNSGRQEIVEIGDGSYKVFLKKSPEDNKANDELVKLLKKHFRRDVMILKGFTSRNKLVEVDDDS